IARTTELLSLHVRDRVAINLRGATDLYQWRWLYKVSSSRRKRLVVRTDQSWNNQHIQGSGSGRRYNDDDYQWLPLLDTHHKEWGKAPFRCYNGSADVDH